MEKIIQHFTSMNLNINSLWKIALVLLLGTFLISVIGRFIFGKRSTLNNAVSSAIGILFIYAITIVVNSLGISISSLLAPLPFITISGDVVQIFSFKDSAYPEICTQLLNMVILAFLVNLVDGWLPKGKNLFTWLFFRILTVIIGTVMHIIAVSLLARYLPEGIVIYAPSVLLAILVILLLTGALKILVGAALITVNPIIGALYTFFFATMVGKQITKAVLTTLLLSLLVLGLNYLDCNIISIATGALVAYIPFVVVLIILWFIVGKLF